MSIKLITIALGLTLITSHQAMATITEKKFQQILNRLEGLYREDILRVTGRQLRLIRQWNTSNHFNVDSSLQHPQLTTADVTITGLLAHHPSVTADAFALMICHEFGHHLGGLPKQPQVLVKWSSVEGQADYWAAQKCLRRYFEEFPEIEMNEMELISNSIPVELKAKCEMRFSNKGEQFNCLKIIKASLSLVDYFNKNLRAMPPIDPIQPDPLVVIKTKIKYGTPQCRIDTFIAAALCDQSSLNDLFCEQGPGGGEEMGSRPRCWFAP